MKRKNKIKQSDINNESDQCRILNKENLIEIYSERIKLLGYDEDQLINMSNTEICLLLFPSFNITTQNNPIEFNYDECISSKHINHYSNILLPKDIIDPVKKCTLLKHSIKNEYNTQDNIYFNQDKVLENITSNTGIHFQKHQINAATFLLENRGLLAIHRAGSGKTYLSLLSILLLYSKYPYLRFIVILPESLKTNFTNQMIQFGISPLGGYHQPSKLYSGLLIEIYTIDEYYEFYNKHDIPPSFHNSFLIIDDSHLFNNIDNKKLLAIMTATSQAFKVLLLSSIPIISNLSMCIEMINGTLPLPSRLMTNSEFQSLVNDPISFHNYVKCKVSVYYPEIFSNNEDFPEQIDMPLVVFIMNQEYYDLYHQIELTQSESDSNPLNFMKLRRALNSLDGEFSPKIDWTLNFILKEASEGRKSIVFSNWKFAGLNLIRRQLDNLSSTVPYSKYVYLSEDISYDHQNRLKDIYNNDQVKILLISRLGGENLDFINTRNIIILESNNNPLSESQIIGRAVRYKSHSTLPPEDRIVKVWRLLMKKPLNTNDKLQSIDEELYSININYKIPEIKSTLELLKKSSIEENNCLPTYSYKSENESSSKEIDNPLLYHEIDYEYIDPVSLISSLDLNPESSSNISSSSTSYPKLSSIIVDDNEWID